MQPASISSRFAAMNLDMLIYMALSQGVMMLIESKIPELATVGVLSLISFILSVLYFVYPTKVSGQTLGKKLLGLKVVPQEFQDEPLSWKQAFMRELVGKIVSSVPFFLGFLWARFNIDRKAWHDMISHTHVLSMVYEDDKTTLQKFQQMMLGVLSIPLGVAVILSAFLYTALPLDAIKEKIEAAGIQVGSLTGSLAGGLHFSEIRRDDEIQKFSLGAVDVKFNLSSLVYDRVFVIDKLTAEEGHIEVPVGFSWATVFLNLMAMSTGESGTTLGNFRMAKMQLKNISFENEKNVLSSLEELSVKNMEMADKELRINEVQFKIPDFTIKVLDFKSREGRIEVAAATGGVGPEFLPLLKSPVDFHFKGVIGKTSNATKFEGGMTIDKIKFSYNAGRLEITVDKLLLNEMFKTALPLEDLDLRLNADGANAFELMTSLDVEYGIKVCGNEFKLKQDKAVNDKTPTFLRADRQFQFHMMPKPVENLSQVIFAKDANLDQLFLYQLQGKKQISPKFANHQEIVSDLCFQKPIASLQAPELEKIQPLILATESDLSGAGLQALLLKSVPITVSRQEATPVVVAAATPAATPAVTPADTPAVTSVATPTEAVTPTPQPSSSPAQTMPTEKVQTAISEARALLRDGKLAEAQTLLEDLSKGTNLLAENDQATVNNLKAWIYFYSSKPLQAAQSFELAFNARKEMSDAEGLLRSYEELKNEAEAAKWLEYIKKSLQEKPELKNHLSPNMQKRFAPAPAIPGPPAPVIPAPPVPVTPAASPVVGE